MTTRLFNSSSINDFRASASKRIFTSAILFSAFFAGAEHVCQAFTLGYSAGVLDRLSVWGDHLVLPSPGPSRRRRPGHMILSQI